MRISRYIAGFALAAVAVLGTAVFGAAAPASAHDELISSSPATGEQLAAAPATIDLVFSAELLDVGTLVLVVDSDEEDWAAGDAVVTGTDVSVPVTESMPDGAYEARWRVVSSDGHPISGVIPFTVGDPVAAEEVPSAPEPSATADPSATPDSSDQSGGDSGMLRIALIGGAGAIIALAVFAIITFLRRRKRDADDA